MQWLIALIKNWLSISASIKDKEQQDIGKTKQVNTDLTAALKLAIAQNKALENEPTLEDSLTHGSF